ncbi:Maintenance of ploidy protein mob2 [Apiospora arundinis]
MGSEGVKMSKTVRIGVDVGGTNTDAVAIDPTQQSEPGRGVLAHHKTPTTPDVTEGIETAVRTVLEKSRLATDAIASVTVGTTHFINAVVEQDARRLHRVAILRLSRSFLREIPPFSEFPPALTKIIKGYVGYCDGGLHIDGSEEAPIVESQVVERCREIKELGLTAVVIVGAFSPIDEVFQQEDRVRDIVLRKIPGADVVVSHEVANIGLLERENASILNAAILQYARRTVRGFRRAMKALNLHCPLFLTQNDGTLLDAAAAAKIPIRTFNSGATNSMRGAAYLAGHDTQDSSAIVADIGGTTTDVGVLLPSGLPRQASAYVTVAGVRVNYSMPHLHSIGLGGGSTVRQTEDGKVTVGPGSVGHYLTRDALAFGGKVTTASDIAVTAGRAKMGTSTVTLDSGLVAAAEEQIKKLLEGVVDLIKTSPEPLPVLLVGGGAVLSPSTLEGASELRRPAFADVANAVGAAISNVGGTVDVIQSVADQSIREAVERAKAMAIQRAIDAGAERDSVRIAEEESYPVTYVANKLRTVVKAIGKLDTDLHSKPLKEEEDFEEDEGEEEESEATKDFSVIVAEEPHTDPVTYRPQVIRNKTTGILEWHISETDINYLADGCYVLGCAGGGSPAASRIQLRDMLRAGHTMRVIDTSSLDPQAVVYWGGHMGSPATSNERLQSIETVYAFQALMEYRRELSFDAVISLEIGGANGLEPFLVGSSRFFDRPILDGDFMGRAYPTYWQTTLAVHAPNELVPCAIDSGDGKTILMVRAPDDEIVDRALRASCSEMGSRVGMASCPTTAEKVGKFAVLKTVSLAWRIGRCIARAEATNTLSTVAESIVQEVGGPKSAKILFRGKIVAVERRLFKGHSHGSITIAGLIPSEEENSSAAGQEGVMPAVKTGGTLRIPFKNENLFAEHLAEDGTTKSIIASVPDLICVLDTSSGRNLGVPEFKYGFRVTVLGITCSPRWTETLAGLKIGGPGAFGYNNIDYQPIGQYVEPKSVIEEFAPAV